MGQIQVAPLSAAAAGAALAQAGVRDPRGINSPESIAMHADACVGVRAEQGGAVLALRRDGRTLWIDGAASADGRGLVPLIADVAQRAAKLAGCARVALESDRPGFVRLAQRLGWRVAAVLPLARPAFIIEKEV